jgi:hypothetical protein
MSFTYSHGHQVPWDQYQTDIVKKNKEIAQLKEDARTNLDYSLKYEKDLVKKNEEIAELKAENEKLKDEDKCVMDMLEPAIKEEVALLKEKNDELESEVLDARESFNLQQQSDLFYCRGYIYCDPETGENMTKDGLMKLHHKCYIATKENAELKAENEKWGCWASDVLYYSHSASKDTLQAKNLITESNQPTFTKIRNFGEEIEKLKAENYKLKEQFEVIEQSTESCAYMELEIERLQSADYIDEILRENMDDAMGNWVDDVFGVCDLDEVKKQMDELKAENEKLNSQKKEEKVKDVKVGEGDVGWEKY